jgi:chorismate mutase
MNMNATPISATLEPGARPLIFDAKEAVLLMLPEAAQAKLIELREARDNQHATLMPVTDSLQEKREVQQRWEARIRQLESDLSVRETENHPSLVDAERQRAKVMEEVARLSASKQSMSERLQARGGLVSRIESYLLKLLRENINVAPHIGQAKLSTAEPARAAVDRVRKQVAEALADLHTVMSAPIKSDAAKEIARTQINQLADRGAPDCDRLLAHGAPLEWPEFRESISVRGGTSGAVIAVGSTSTPDGLAFLTWLNRDAVIAAVEREIDELADDTQALTDAERTKRSVKLRTDILALERQEEILIIIAGDFIIRRVDADPRAVLGLSSDMPSADNL